MSLTPMLHDKEKEQMGSVGMRSHSVGARSILGPRSLNLESASNAAAGTWSSDSELRHVCVCVCVCGSPCVCLQVSLCLDVVSLWFVCHMQHTLNKCST